MTKERVGSEPEDWRVIYRKADEPPIKVGDMILGMHQEKDGQWVKTIAPVKAVELADTENDGGRHFRVRLGGDVVIGTRMFVGNGPDRNGFWGQSRDCLFFLRRTEQPPIQVGDMLPGMRLEGTGRWVKILTPALAVELLSTSSSGLCRYLVTLGDDTVVDDSQ